VSWSHSALVAETYDIAHPLGSSAGDVEFYTRALAEVSGRILEPACGTGRMLIPLLAAGHLAEGSDQSPDMLAICREHCEALGLAPQLYEADMAEILRPGGYQAIVLPRGSIRNVNGRDATRRTLTCFLDSLSPGGSLFLDVTIPLFVPGQLPMIEHWVKEPFVYTCETLVIDYNPFLDLTTRYARYAKWQDGELVKTELHRFYFQHWNLTDFTDLLGVAGFTDVKVAGNYTDVPPGEGHRYWNFSARKPAR
jgi:SAM-dependent methyltransferase